MAPPPPTPLIHGSTAPSAKVVAITASMQSPPSASTAAPTSAARRDCAATMPPFDVTAALRMSWALENWSRMGFPCGVVLLFLGSLFLSAVPPGILARHVARYLTRKCRCALLDK